MKHLKKMNESNEDIKISAKELVRHILDGCKLDVDAIEESDPEFVDYISDMIIEWHKNNK